MLTFTPLRYPQIWSPSPYFARSRKNSSTASLLYSLPRGSSTTGRASGLYEGSATTGAVQMTITITKVTVYETDMTGSCWVPFDSPC